LGSEAEICSVKRHVRSTSGSESGFSQKAMSALPFKPDRCSAKRNVGYGPEADIRTLFYNPVSLDLDHIWNFDAEGGGSLCIYHHVELSRLFRWQFFW
jgi:hypothetical protein